MQVIEVGPKPLLSLAFSPDGLFLASGTNFGMVHLFNSGGEPLATFGELESQPRYCLQFAQDQNRVFFSSGDVLEEWSSEYLGRLIPTEPRQFRRAMNVSDRNSPDVEVLSFQEFNATTLAVGIGHPVQARPGRFLLWDVKNNKALQPTFREPDGVRGVAVHAASKTVAWTTGGRSWSLWNATKPDRKVFSLKVPPRAIAFHPDGKMVALGCGWEVHVIHLEISQPPIVLKGHKGQVNCLAFSPDGRTLASASWAGCVRLWDLASTREQACFNWPVGRVNALTYAPDGLRLAAASEQGKIVIWDCE